MRAADRTWPTKASDLKTQLKIKSRTRREALAPQGLYLGPTLAARNDILPSLHLTNLPLSTLRAPAREIRRVNPAHVAEVARSISTLGFCVPVLVGADHLVLDGWIRVEAAKSLGLDHAPCLRIDHLSGTEQRLLRLAVNRLGEKGEWNLEELKVEFTELILEDAPIEIVGFDAAEIDHIILDDVEGIEPGLLAPGPTTSVATSRRGDVFALARHKLMCGDATSLDDLVKLMEDCLPARLILTDEPYNVPIAGHVSGSHREFIMGSGEMSEAEFLAFNQAWMRAGLKYLADGGVFATFIDWRGFPTVHAAAVDLGLTPLNLVVWGKTNAGMGSLYRSQHELLPMFKKGSVAHVNNVELGKRGRWRSNLWTYPGASSLGSDARKGLEQHPMVKPTAMLEDALLDLTQRADVVLDPFLSSGSTLLAAHKTNRICSALELDPLYVDVSIRRIEAVTGLTARLLETGETFAEMTQRRIAEKELPA
jgi:DNA modification methylase